MLLYIGVFRVDNGARNQEDVFCSAYCRTKYELDHLAWDNTFGITHTYADSFTREYDPCADEIICQYCAR